MPSGWRVLLCPCRWICWGPQVLGGLLGVGTLVRLLWRTSVGLQGFMIVIGLLKPWVLMAWLLEIGVWVGLMVTLGILLLQVSWL